jgi:hypothetical protein
MHRVRSGLAAFAVVGALLLAACGEDDPTPSNSPSATTLPSDQMEDKSDDQMEDQDGEMKEDEMKEEGDDMMEGTTTSAG